MLHREGYGSHSCSGTSIHYLPLSQDLVMVTAGCSRCPSPKHYFTAPPGGSRVLPSPDRIHNPSKFWVWHGSPPSWMCPEYLNGKAFRGHPEPPELAPFDVKEQRRYSKLHLEVRTPHTLISKAEHSHPEEGAHFDHWGPRLFFFFFLVTATVGT